MAREALHKLEPHDEVQLGAADPAEVAQLKRRVQEVTWTKVSRHALQVDIRMELNGNSRSVA